MTMTRNTALALLGIGLLTLSAIAAPVVAKPGDDASARREAAQDKREERREAVAEQAEARGNATKERCLAAHANHTLNESAERRCMKVGEFAEKAFKARRAAHALLGAINATERQWAKLNATEERLEAKLAAGNASANETAAIEKRLERIDAKQERLADRLERLRERLAGLHERWDAVREHVAERRAKHHEQEDDDESSSSSSSSSSSASESSSSSSSSSESSSESGSESSSSSSPPA